MGWRVDREEKDTRRGARGSVRRWYAVLDSTLTYLARLPLSRGREAYLMAAAPDLLEALEDVLAVVPALRDGTMRPLVAKLKAAIAKARDYPCADCEHPAFEHNGGGCMAETAGAGAGRMGMYNTAICQCQKYLKPKGAV